MRIVAWVATNESNSRSCVGPTRVGIKVQVMQFNVTFLVQLELELLLYEL